MRRKNIYKVIGCMSGTSMDGVDLAYCEFTLKNEKYHFDIIDAETIPYDPKWKNQLMNADRLDGHDLFILDHKYGDYLGKLIRDFRETHSLTPDFVSSHGHTVFHEPGKGGSLQIGNGHNLYIASGLPCITDFRNLDIALGGQGAPLVPAGDAFLFPEYNYCLNLGGFANISFRKNKKRLAYDICPVNTLLNRMAKFADQEYDDDGKMGRKGKPDSVLVKKLNSIEYYKYSPPKSMGKELLIKDFFPLLDNSRLSLQDILSSLYEHISTIIAAQIDTRADKRILITGGGAKNTFLIQKLADKIAPEIVIPDTTIIDFKEALIFAFLGVLRQRREVNCFASVTGANRDSSCGVIYGNLS